MIKRKITTAHPGLDNVKQSPNKELYQFHPRFNLENISAHLQAAAELYSRFKGIDKPNLTNTKCSFSLVLLKPIKADLPLFYDKPSHTKQNLS